MNRLLIEQLLSLTCIAGVIITVLACVWRKRKMKEEQLQTSDSIAHQAALKARKRYVPDYMVLEPAPKCQCSGGDIQLCGVHTSEQDPNNEHVNTPTDERIIDLYAEVKRPRQSQQLPIARNRPSGAQDKLLNQKTSPGPDDDDTENIYTNRIHQGAVIDWQNQTKKSASLSPTSPTARTRSPGHHQQNNRLPQPQFSFDYIERSDKPNEVGLYSVVEIKNTKFCNSDGTSQSPGYEPQISPEAVHWEENELYESGGPA